MRLILLLCTMLAGCATPEQIAARRAQEAYQREQLNAAYTQHLASQCRAVGYQEGSDGFRNCLLTIHGQNRQDAAQRRAQAIQQQQQYQQQPTYQPTYRRPQPTFTNCQRDAWGNVNCVTH